MNVTTLLFLVFTFCFTLKFSLAQQCSTTQPCNPTSLCCSQWGWCGSTSDYCGTGCKNGPCSGGTPVAIPAPQATVANRRHIVAFYPDWYSSSPSTIRYADVTHIIWSFAIPCPTCSSFFNPINNPSKLTELVDRSHTNNVKVLISVGGATYPSSSWNAFASDATKRQTFARSLLNLINLYGADGADIDWELIDTTSVANNFLALMETTYQLLRANGKILTADLMGSSWYGQYTPSSVFAFADWFHVMAYDYTGGWPGSPVGHHATYADATSALTYWHGRGLAKNKIVFGIPFYGKEWVSGTVIDRSYSWIIATHNPATNVNNIGQLWWDSYQLVQDKCTYVNNNAYLGVMFWEYLQDDSGSKSLLTAIRSKITPNK